MVKVSEFEDAFTETLGFLIHTSAMASPPIAAPFNPGSGITVCKTLFDGGRTD
jgi:hypothetical protein